MTFTYRIETGPQGAPEVWVDTAEGLPTFHQPHHPEAVNYAPWENREAAEIWATGFVYQLNNPTPPAPKEELA